MTTNKTIWLALLWVLLLSVSGQAAARFLSPDPKPADEQNFNRYWYANNNPYTFVDPDGREGVAIWRMDRAIDDMNAGRISVSEFRAQRDAAGTGALIGLGIVGAGYGGGALLANPAAVHNAAVVVGDIAAGDAIGGASLSVPLAAGIKVTADVIASALSDSKMLTTQRGVSVPVVKNYVERLAGGSPAPPISVDGDVIVEGAHRYVAARILGQDPNIVPGSLPPSQAPLAYPIRDIKPDPADWGNR